MKPRNYRRLDPRPLIREISECLTFLEKTSHFYSAPIGPLEIRIAQSQPKGANISEHIVLKYDSVS